MKAVKTELVKIHFEFKRKNDIHTITYQFIGMQKQFNSKIDRNKKTWRVFYGVNGKLKLRCGETQVSPCITDARLWLKQTDIYLSAHPED